MGKHEATRPAGSTYGKLAFEPETQMPNWGPALQKRPTAFIKMNVNGQTSGKFFIMPVAKSFNPVQMKNVNLASLIWKPKPYFTFFDTFRRTTLANVCCSMMRKGKFFFKNNLLPNLRVDTRNKILRKDKLGISQVSKTNV
mmetsp:Transcript_15368/g.23380  ORF Transcript_15368/g.23380 Transcript_15368/m.23380 type:complete len:141 (+) Transcript_15368:757-1179(+)